MHNRPGVFQAFQKETCFAGIVGVRLTPARAGTALLHARTETDWFKPVWEHASGGLIPE